MLKSRSVYLQLALKYLIHVVTHEIIHCVLCLLSRCFEAVVVIHCRQDSSCYRSSASYNFLHCLREYDPVMVLVKCKEHCIYFFTQRAFAVQQSEQEDHAPVKFVLLALEELVRKDSFQSGVLLGEDRLSERKFLKGFSKLSERNIAISCLLLEYFLEWVDWNLVKRERALQICYFIVYESTLKIAAAHPGYTLNCNLNMNKKKTCGCFSFFGKKRKT